MFSLFRSFYNHPRLCPKCKKKFSSLNLIEYCYSISEWTENESRIKSWRRLVKAAGGWPLISQDTWNVEKFKQQNLLPYIFNIGYQIDLTNASKLILGVCIAYYLHEIQNATHYSNFKSLHFVFLALGSRSTYSS